MNADPAGPSAPLSDEEYQRLLSFRTELRSFLRWSEDAASNAGLTPALHQLLLAVRGQRGEGPPSVGDVAEALHMRHHSAVELAQRAEAAGMLSRVKDPADQRRIRLVLTSEGQERLDALTAEHLPRIAQLSVVLRELTSVGGADRPSGS